MTYPLTILTPTYNRARILGKLYHSLCNQSNKNFEWIIVDDGSDDETRELVVPWIEKKRVQTSSKITGVSQCGFVVKYLWQNNGGKHTAVNRGVEEAQGKYTFIVDSDDSLPKSSVDTVINMLKTIQKENMLGGVAGFMAHHDGKIIGHGYNFDILDTNSLDLRYKYHIQGDMAEVFRTDVLREFPFPEFAEEKFCPEALVWNRIAQKYNLRFFHEVIYFRDYLAGGLTDKITKIRQNSPLGSCTHYKELNGYSVPFIQKAKAAINYWRFRCCATHVADFPKLPFFWNAVMPIGYLMRLKDK